MRKKYDENNLPKHIAIIMDGNGRWATKRGLPRTAGHRAGVDALTKVSEICRDLGGKVVSVYAVSTENYQRSDSECTFIFDLVARFSREKLNDLIKSGGVVVVDYKLIEQAYDYVVVVELGE